LINFQPFHADHAVNIIPAAQSCIGPHTLSHLCPWTGYWPVTVGASVRLRAAPQQAPATASNGTVWSSAAQTLHTLLLQLVLLLLQ
jgi:hypothetical protein